jgi:putative Mg2+ transporter-C (MgtC) family protein
MNLLTADWKTLLPYPLAQSILALVALFCGAIIGSERQKHEKPAGLRTLILVCLGSAAFTMAGYAFTGSSGDSGRVAAQIVTGIGFLGAGIILHPRGTISGATTAAAIWVTASVGMLAGAGYAGGAMGLTILVRMVLGGVSMYEARLFGDQPPVIVTLDFDASGGRTRVRLERILIDYGVSNVATEWTSIAAETDRLTLRLHLPRRHLRELLDDLVDIPEVRKVREENAAPVRGGQTG